MTAADFWEDQEKANEVLSRMKYLKGIVEPFQTAENDCKDFVELGTLLEQEELEDLSSEVELEKAVEKLTRQVDQLELKSLLSDKLDSMNAIVSINAGAGGTESCDWAEMLFRMYQKWAETRGSKVSIIEILAGDEAGIKNVTFTVSGDSAYGYLKAERGVHRLVRISPFDSNKRRHTSFASVGVIAEVTDDIDIEIDPADLRIDTYRASGAGGQHVNKTDSAVRITHEPTGIVVQCQNDRSQHKNKAQAMKVLKARLYEKKREEEEAERAKQYGEKKKIEWGSQIRSYVFHPYSMVKDHRTNHETSNTQKVMDGDIDAFIEAYLKFVVSL